MDLDSKLARLDYLLRRHSAVLVAFSGGADSAFLLAAAARALPPGRVIGATAVSPSLPAAELAAAAAFAAQLGVAHHTPRTDEMSREQYRANDGDRCFHCKAELLDTLRALADAVSIETIATGTNADDVVAGFRPGIRAAAERGAVTPLVDAGLTKSDIREASREWGLSTWDKPAAACLSSRVAFGIEITPARLSRVERAEAASRQWLVANGFAVRNLRVRDVGDTARLEVDLDVLRDLDGRSDEVCAQLVAAGFARAEVDPRGFRSGSMNELLAEPDRWR